MHLEHIRFQIGRTSLATPATAKFGGDLIFPMPYIDEGEPVTRFVKAVTDVASLGLETLVWSKVPQPGDPAEGDFAYEHNLGAFVFCSDDRDAIERDIRQAMTRFKIEV